MGIQATEAPATPTPEPKNLWLEGKMGDLPNPGHAVLSVSETGKGTEVSIGDITSDEAATYIETVKGLGYSTRVEGEDDKGGFMYGGSKNNYVVTIIFAVEDSSSGTGSCQITYGKAS